MHSRESDQRATAAPPRPLTPGLVVNGQSIPGPQDDDGQQDGAGAQAPVDRSASTPRSDVSPKEATSQSSARSTAVSALVAAHGVLNERDAADQRSHSDTSGEGEGPLKIVVVNHIPMSEVTRVAVVLIGIGLGTYLIWRIHTVVFLLFLAILLGTAIEPLVNRLRRGPFSRGSGVLAVYTMIILVLAVPITVVAPNLAAQAGSFSESLPQQIEGLRPVAQGLRPVPVRDAALDAIDRFGSTIQQPVAPRSDAIVAVGATAAKTLIDFLMVFVLAFYWLVERAFFKRNLLRLVPRSRAKDVNTVWVEVEDKLGGWVRGQLICMIAVGLAAGAGFFFIGLPNPILLGVIAGLCEIIPIIGPFLAFAPALIVALTMGPQTAVIVLVYAIVVQQLEGNVLVPRVMSHVVGVSPLTVVIGILSGAAISGAWGALVAVPIAGAIQVVLSHALHTDDPALQTK